MPNIEKTLKEKGAEYQYGDYQDRAYTMQALKETMRHECSPPWEKLEPVVRESLDMIMHKVGRILNGSPYEPDHWMDIAGYAMLVVKQMKKR